MRDLSGAEFFVFFRDERSIGGSARVRSLRQVGKQDPENQIDGQKLHALKRIHSPSPLI